MIDLDAIFLKEEVKERIAKTLALSDVGLAEFVRVAGLDPAFDFQGQDLRGWPLAGQDIRGFNFSDSDLRSTGIERALSDKTTILTRAKLDRVSKKSKSITDKDVVPKSIDRVYTKVRVPDLTDAELLERNFLVSEPESLENLTAGAPPTDQWLTYEGRYDVGKGVTCAFGHHHKRGYIFRDEVDRRYLVGHECGAKHLGLGRWQTFTAGRERLEERASYLRLIRDLADAFSEQRDWIAGLRKDQSVLAADAVRRQLQARCPDAVAAARLAFSRYDGAISIKVTVRDFGAEERRREREVEAKEKYDALNAAELRAFHEKGKRPPTIDRSPLVKQEIKSLGTLQGRRLFSENISNAKMLNDLLELIDRFLAMPFTPKSRKELMTVARNAKELVSRVQRLENSVSDAVAFFEQSNLEKFANWADRNSFDGLRYEARSASLVTEKIEGGNFQEIIRPSNLRNINKEPLAKLQAAIQGVSNRANRARRRQ
ncbi:hypothetical protein MMB17_02905 [Methylobacterium organophilum]|uniref:hypothetical protein n=1 Tax=Methylobacterium organophilum TaxID=410 RepID=UPI001F142869|nr:hypothetical protein [Methylobacterium organophilum]UMY18316.1 hypothetical protein MMB17_02905 [Methylobacterium organophilum]